MASIAFRIRLVNTCCSSPSQPSTRTAARRPAAPSGSRSAACASGRPAGRGISRPAARGHRLRLVLAACGRTQEVVDDPRGAEGLPFDLLQDARSGGPSAPSREQHLGVAGDAGDRRVDLVRHAGGEHAEGGQAVLLAQAQQGRVAGCSLDGGDDGLAAGELSAQMSIARRPRACRRGQARPRSGYAIASPRRPPRTA